MARLRSYREFWPYYVREHASGTTRALHFAGTAGVIALAIAAAVSGNGWLLLAVPVLGYGFAWFAHAFVERNKPATFTHPLWSLIGDFHMFALMLTGRMEREVAHHREGSRLADRKAH
ncbi:MAG: DUF962 domain-containing protein [Proteobacteria bacterium]|nr:DUF962 domain-containing protein [Pseudomonadota bacterium]